MKSYPLQNHRRTRNWRQIDLPWCCSGTSQRCGRKFPVVCFWSVSTRRRNSGSPRVGRTATSGSPSPLRWSPSPLLPYTGYHSSSAMAGGKAQRSSTVRNAGRWRQQWHVGRERRDEWGRVSLASLPYPHQQGQYGELQEYVACKWAQVRGRRRTGDGCGRNRIVMASFE